MEAAGLTYTVDEEGTYIIGPAKTKSTTRVVMGHLKPAPVTDQSSTTQTVSDTTAGQPADAAQTEADIAAQQASLVPYAQVIPTSTSCPGRELGAHRHGRRLLRSGRDRNSGRWRILPAFYHRFRLCGYGRVWLWLRLAWVYNRRRSAVCHGQQHGSTSSIRMGKPGDGEVVEGTICGPIAALLCHSVLACADITNLGEIPRNRGFLFVGMLELVCLKIKYFDNLMPDALHGVISVLE